MNIPNEAVEAAAKVISDRMYATEDDWPEIARAALEAAAPRIRAQALEDAANDYRYYSTPNARVYLRDRAAAERGQA